MTRSSTHLILAAPLTLLLAAALSAGCAAHPYGAKTARKAHGRCVPKDDTAAPSGVITNPTPILHAPPVLTPEAIAAGVHGPVPVRCVLLADGTLHECLLQRPIPSMDAVIMQALSRWTYAPATEDGVPTAVEVALSVPLAQPDTNAPAAANDDAPTTNDVRDPVMSRAGKMTPPRLIDPGEPIEVTNEALESCSRGTLIARCVLNTDGHLTNCVVVKSLRGMNESVLRSLETRRYAPVLFNGKPVAVNKVFRVNVELPAE
jgi:hypothetical protein